METGEEREVHCISERTGNRGIRSGTGGRSRRERATAACLRWPAYTGNTRAGSCCSRARARYSRGTEACTHAHRCHCRSSSSSTKRTEPNKRALCYAMQCIASAGMCLLGVVVHKALFRQAAVAPGASEAVRMPGARHRADHAAHHQLPTSATARREQAFEVVRAVPTIFELQIDSIYRDVRAHRVDLEIVPKSKFKNGAKAQIKRTS